MLENQKKNRKIYEHFYKDMPQMAYLLLIIVTYLVTLNGTYLEDYSNNIIADMSLPLNLKSEQEQDRLRDI